MDLAEPERQYGVIHPGQRGIGVGMRESRSEPALDRSEALIVAAGANSDLHAAIALINEVGDGQTLIQQVVLLLQPERDDMLRGMDVSLR